MEARKNPAVSTATTAEVTPRTITMSRITPCKTEAPQTKTPVSNRNPAPQHHRFRHTNAGERDLITPRERTIGCIPVLTTLISVKLEIQYFVRAGIEITPSACFHSPNVAAAKQFRP